MSVPSRDALEEEICTASYCPYIREGGSTGVHGGPNGPYSCEGCYCDEAYEAWLEKNLVQCARCLQEASRDICESFKNDCETYYVCEKCMEESE